MSAALLSYFMEWMTTTTSDSTCEIEGHWNGGVGGILDGAAMLLNAA